jgi:lysyl-tRNA synthetase class 2
MDIELLESRARIFREVRGFFDSRDYLETDTPLLAPNLIPESCLEVFETAYLRPNSRPKPYWLIPSPEIWMKRLIAQHRKKVYQICKCFRNGESTGHLHSPEFTMLEYYTMDADYKDSLALTEALFASLLGPCSKGPSPELAAELAPPFMRITMEEAFVRWAGFSLFEAAERGTLADEARKLGLAPAGLGMAALYDLIFIHAVEPRLPKDRVVAILDYPAFVPCLARKGKDGGPAPKPRTDGSLAEVPLRKTMERWELYVHGIELANCFSEATDPEEVRCFFQSEQEAKLQSALVPHAVDEDYWKIFRDAKGGFPRCSGVALGLDRLVMALAGRSTIDSILPFPMEG